MVLRQEGRVVNPVLTPFQEELLRAVAGTEIGEAFFLTGGTALAAFYLHHRLSEDLDFFTSDDAAMTWGDRAPRPERPGRFDRFPLRG